MLFYWVHPLDTEVRSQDETEKFIFLKKPGRRRRENLQWSKLRKLKKKNVQALSLWCEPGQIGTNGQGHANKSDIVNNANMATILSPKGVLPHSSQKIQDAEAANFPFLF